MTTTDDEARRLYVKGDNLIDEARGVKDRVIARRMHDEANALFKKAWHLDIEADRKDDEDAMR